MGESIPLKILVEQTDLWRDVVNANKRLQGQRDEALARVAELEANLNATVLLLGDALERERQLLLLLADIEDHNDTDPASVRDDLRRRIRDAITPEAGR